MLKPRQQVNMMFFANSRSRFKSRPPKILIYCLKSILFSVLLIVLIAQLRAIELPVAETADSSEPKLTNTSETNQNGTTGRGAIDSRPTISPNPIDRDVSEKSEDTNGLVASAEGDVRSLETLANNATSQVISASISPTGNEQQAPVSGESSVQANDSNAHIDDLSVSPATNQVQTATTNADGSNSDEYQGASLAELTAAGTAAGLLVHDLMAQPNMENGLTYGPGGGGGDSSNSDQGDDDGGGNELASVGNSGAMPLSSDSELSSQMGQMMTNNLQQDDQRQTQPLMQQDSERLFGMPASYGEDEAEPTGENSPSSRPGRSGESDNRFNSRMATTGGGSGSLVQAESASSEPNSEDASPDSIESLMGADGAALEANDEAQSQVDEEQSQQPSDSHLVNRNGDAKMLQGQLAAPSRPIDKDDGDDYDGEGDDASTSDLQLQTEQTRQKGVVPVMMSTHYKTDDDSQVQSMPTGRPGELEQNLVAPMRESLSDLNAAAGHYYGKKKKKKVKKIVIKKKKKRVKKKYKKIKIVKIKKKKKIKKKPKKMVMHHHPDHGKYYMYAKVPKKKSWEFGFKKGNKKHWIERHEKGHKNKFKTKVQWFDKKSKGKGVHIWDYNHYDKKKKKHH